MRTPIWKPVTLAAGAALLVGGMGAAATRLSPWYYALRKPSWQPPDWLFGPVWTTIFALCAIAGVLGWRRGRTRASRNRIIFVFALNAGLNVLWSLLFFRLHRPDFALIEVGPLWLSVALASWVLWPLSRTAGGLLLPYMAWVAFAAFLNFTIVQLNAPFSST